MRRLAVLALALALVGVPAIFGPAPAHAQGGYGSTHVVKPGETLYSIAHYYGVSATELAKVNGLFNPDYIYAGQALTVPGGGYAPQPSPYSPPASGSYVVRLGDTLYSIAYRNGTTISAILAANHLSNPDYIYAGQVLAIPGAYAPPPPGYQPGPPPYYPPAADCGTYVVKRGDTLSAIAARSWTTTAVVAHANGLKYPYIIYPGQRLRVPCGDFKPDHPRPKPPAPRPTAAPTHHPAACPREVQIAWPLQGQHVSGVVQIVGTANIPDFQFYKLEYAMGHTPLETAFASINGTHGTAATDTVLGTWFVGNMPAGAYTLRLTAVDLRGQFPRPCDVRLHIDD